MSTVDWAVSLMETLGGPGAGLAIAAENLFPPIPSEVILPLAGFTASQGDLSLASALIWTTIGSLVGAVMLYGLGAWLGRERLRAIVVRMPLMDVEDLEKAEAWFVRHGTKAVFFGRFIPVVRSLISVPAGVERMPLHLFMFYTLMGSAIWNTIFVMAGYQLGENWTTVEGVVGTYSKGVVLVAGTAILIFIGLRIRRFRLRALERAAAAERAADEGDNDRPRYRDEPVH